MHEKNERNKEIIKKATESIKQTTTPIQNEDYPISKRRYVSALFLSAPSSVRPSKHKCKSEPIVPKGIPFKSGIRNKPRCHTPAISTRSKPFEEPVQKENETAVFSHRHRERERERREQSRTSRVKNPPLPRSVEQLEGAARVSNRKGFIRATSIARHE